MWIAIYSENCFGSPSLFSRHEQTTDMCYEERVFYRLMSGIHASIVAAVSARIHTHVHAQAEHARACVHTLTGQAPQDIVGRIHSQH